MNRRAFIASIPFLPSAAKAVISGSHKYVCEIRCDVRKFTIKSFDVGVVCDRKTRDAIENVFSEYYAKKHGAAYLKI